MNWKQRMLHRFRYRLIRYSELPKANLTSTLLNLAARGFAPGLAIDVGANRGDWSRALRGVFPDCQTFMIEPQIEMKQILDDFCARNVGCKWLQAGAGSSIGEQTFYAHPDTVSSSFNSRHTSSETRKPPRMVQVVTLDHVTENMIGGTVPDILKIDAEGWEREVLDGASTLLGKTELVFLEAHLFGDSPNPSGFVELTRLMDQHGYVPYDFTWFGRRPFDQAIGLCEIVFARRTGALRTHLGWGTSR